jgi:hypothetical protein
LSDNAPLNNKQKMKVWIQYQEMDAILLIIGIVYGVCRIVIKSVQQYTYFLFSVNLLLVGVNYGQRTTVSKYYSIFAAHQIYFIPTVIMTK